MRPSENSPEIIIQIDDRNPVSLGLEASLALLSIAMHNRITISDAIAVSLTNDIFLQQQIENGGKLLIKRAGTIRRFEYS